MIGGPIGIQMVGGLWDYGAAVPFNDIFYKTLLSGGEL